MGIREGARPKTQAEIDRYAELERMGIERQKVFDLQDPVKYRQRQEQEQREREAYENSPDYIPPYEPTLEDRIALGTNPAQRTPEMKARLEKRDALLGRAENFF